MKATIQVKELTHEELVNIFSNATYDNSSMGIRIPKESKELVEELKADNSINTDCREDLWAEVLLNGGSISIIDNESDAEDEKDAIECAYGGYGHKVGYRVVEGFCGDYGVTTYDVNMQEFLNGCSNDDAMEYLKDTLDGSGDMYDAYNLLQIIAFGEVIYG